MLEHVEKAFPGATAVDDVSLRGPLRLSVETDRFHDFAADTGRRLPALADQPARG